MLKANCIEKRATRLFKTFQTDESGLALIEYLVLLGLLASGVVLAVFSVGEALGNSWLSWTGLYNTFLAP